MMTYIELLGGECPDANPGSVGLHHTVHVTDTQRGDAQPGAHTTHGAV